MIATSTQFHTLNSIGASVNCDDYAVDATYYADNLASPSFGSLSNSRPIEQIPLAVDGTRSSSYLDNHYNRIWIIPNLVSLGKLLSESNTEVEVWNAFFETRELTDITVQGDDEGLNLSGIPTGNFTALQSKIGNLEALLLGTPAIDVQYIFTWGGSGDVGALLAVTGSRITVFKLRHNWAANILEQISFKTEVFAGLSGKEQRRKLIQIPRRRIEMSYLTLTANERAYLEQVLNNQGREFAVPLWQDVSHLSSAYNAGSTVFAVETIDRDYEVGSFIFLQDESVSEILEIQSFTDNSVTTTEPSSRAYRAGTRVAPVRFAILEQNISLARLTSHIENIRLAWLLNTDKDRPNQIGTANPAQYLGWDIFDSQNDYTGNISIKQDLNGDWIDNQIGLLRTIKNEPFPRKVYPFTDILDREGLTNFLAWWYRREGRLNPFWFNDRVPSFHLADETALDSVYLTVEDNGYTALSFESASRRDLAIQKTDGTWIYRKIVAAVSNNDDTETLTLDSAPGVNLTVENNHLISFLRPVRLEQDSLEIAYETNDVMRVAVAFTDLLTT